MNPSLRILIAAAAAIALSSCGGSKSKGKSSYNRKPANTAVLPPAPLAVDHSAALFQSIQVKQDMIPAGKVGRWKVRPMRPKYITIHSTQNYSPCADAAQHSLALKRGSLRGKNSLGFMTWHFSVDDNKAIQHLPLNERGEHADFDGPGNRFSIGIEMCENRGSNRAVTVDRCARLTGLLMHAYNIPLSNVVPHYHWPRYKYKNNPHKNCPHFLMDDGRPGKTWKYFLSRVDHYAKNAKIDPPGGNTPRPQALQAYFERGSMVRRGFFAGSPEISDIIQ